MTDRDVILVGVDGSDASVRALQWTVDRAARDDASVEAVHAWHIPYTAGTMGGIAFDVQMLADHAQHRRLPVDRGGHAATARDAQDPTPAVVGRGIANAVVQTDLVEPDRVRLHRQAMPGGQCGDLRSGGWGGSHRASVGHCYGPGNGILAGCAADAGRCSGA